MSKKKKLPQIVKEIRNNPPTPVDFNKEKIVSFSQLSMYNQCPLKWALNYRDGYRIKTQSIHFVFGTAMHETLQHYLDVMYETSGAAADRLEILDIFKDKLISEYNKAREENKGEHFSNADELREFYEDGVAIIDYFKKNKSKHFGKRGYYLAGCELPIITSPNPDLPNVKYIGYLDVVIYHAPTNTFTIYDIKTSTRSWDDNKKKDKILPIQLNLYKKYFSELYKVPIENIDVEFFIVKRKLWENSEFTQSRIQIVKPSSGKTSINRSTKALEEFVNKSFNSNGYSDIKHEPKINKYCKWCEFQNTHLCSATFQE